MALEKVSFFYTFILVFLFNIRVEIFLDPFLIQNYFCLCRGEGLILLCLILSQSKP